MIDKEKTSPELGEQVHKYLLELGIETPMTESEVTDEDKRKVIKNAVTDIMTVLGLDLSDDSLAETPKRISKMYVDELYAGLDYENFPKITTIENKMEDLKYEMQDTLAGTDVKSAIDEFGDAIWDAIVAGEKAMDAFGEKVQDVLKNAVKEALKRQFLAKGINDAIEYLGTAMEDSVLTDEERARFEQLANLAGETYKNAIEGLGDWIMNGEEDTDALAGAITGMSEETGNIVAGRMNAVVINQSMQMELLKEQLRYQATIAANTGISAEKLTQIQESVRRIENRENNLLSQGIS